MFRDKHEHQEHASQSIPILSWRLLLPLGSPRGAVQCSNVNFRWAWSTRLVWNNTKWWKWTRQKGSTFFAATSNQAYKSTAPKRGTFYERRRRRQQTESASCQTNEIQNISFGTNKWGCDIKMLLPPPWSWHTVFEQIPDRVWELPSSKASQFRMAKEKTFACDLLYQLDSIYFVQSHTKPCMLEILKIMVADYTKNCQN